MPDEKSDEKPDEKPPVSVPVLWPPLPEGVEVHGIAEIDTYQQPNGKPCVRLTIPGGTKGDNHVIWVSASLLEMAGGAARGARLRYEDHGGRPGGRG